MSGYEGDQADVGYVDPEDQKPSQNQAYLQLSFAPSKPDSATTTLQLVLSLIVPRFDIVALTKSKRISKSFLKVTQNETTRTKWLQNRITEALDLCHEISRIKPPPNLGKSAHTSDESIFTYLSDTTEGILTYLRLVEPQLPYYVATADFNVVFGLMVLQLHDTWKYFSTTKFYSEAADFHELALRRYLSNLTEIYPGDKEWLPPIECIRDTKSKEIFKSLIRESEVSYLSLATITRELAHHSKDCPEFLSSLNYVLNFPQDSVITAFKWNIFTSMFGPWDVLISNFKKFVIGGGFIGFVNRIQAERILNESAPKSLLMRPSRTHPTVMAVSYKTTSGKLLHVTNNSTWWTMEGFAPLLEAIVKQRGAPKSKSRVPLDYFIQMFEDAEYTVIREKPNLKVAPATLEAFPPISQQALATSFYTEDEGYSAPVSSDAASKSLGRSTVTVHTAPKTAIEAYDDDDDDDDDVNFYGAPPQFRQQPKTSVSISPASSKPVSPYIGVTSSSNGYEDDCVDDSSSELHVTAIANKTAPGLHYEVRPSAVVEPIRQSDRVQITSSAGYEDVDDDEVPMAQKSKIPESSPSLQVAPSPVIQPSSMGYDSKDGLVGVQRTEASSVLVEQQVTATAYKLAHVTPPPAVHIEHYQDIPDEYPTCNSSSNYPHNSPVTVTVTANPAFQPFNAAPSVSIHNATIATQQSRNDQPFASSNNVTISDGYDD